MRRSSSIARGSGSRPRRLRFLDLTSGHGGGKIVGRGPRNHEPWTMNQLPLISRLTATKTDRRGQGGEESRIRAPDTGPLESLSPGILAIQFRVLGRSGSCPTVRAFVASMSVPRLNGHISLHQSGFFSPLASVIAGLHAMSRTARICHRSVHGSRGRAATGVSGCRARLRSE